MTRTTNANYTAADATLGDIAFQVADSDNDLFDRFDVAKLAKAVDVHTHDGAGKGLVTAALAFGAVSQVAVSAFTTGQATTSTTAVDVDAVNLSVTLTPVVGQRLLVITYGSVSNNTAAAFTAFQIYKDGLAVTETSLITSAIAGAIGAFAAALISSATAGVPTTYRLRWRVSAGTAALQTGHILIIEFKK